MKMGKVTPDNESPEGIEPEDYLAALDAIKNIHSAGGKHMTKAETVEFILRPINLGPPLRLKPKGVGRGPQSVDTQYHRANERRRAIYHKLVRNPESARKGGQAMRSSMQSMRELILSIDSRMSSNVRKAKRITEILNDCARAGRPSSRSVVQRALRERDTKG
jgi:hypothetical protein